MAVEAWDYDATRCVPPIHISNGAKELWILTCTVDLGFLETFEIRIAGLAIATAFRENEDGYHYAFDLATLAATEVVA